MKPLRRATQPIHAALDPIRVAASTGLLGVDFQGDIDRVDLNDDISKLKKVDIALYSSRWNMLTPVYAFFTF